LRVAGFPQLCVCPRLRVLSGLESRPDAFFNWVTGHFSKILTAVFVIAGLAHQADAKPAAGQSWLPDLHAEIATDLDAGKPMVVHVHVPLCDNDIIRCGGRGLGDGDNPNRNLYWATSGGFRGWFNRRRSGWREVLVNRGSGDVLETRVWRRLVRPRGALAKVKKPFPVYVVAYAWRGTSIRKAMDTYTRHLYGGDAETITLPDGVKLAAGGASHVVAYVGHNGWMDVSSYNFAEVAKGAKTASKRTKGTIAVACITEDYLSPQVSSKRRVPLLMTKWLLFAGAHSFEGAVSALARGGDLATIRRAAIRAYATGQGKTPRRVSGAFTNPADKRWKGR